MALDHVRPNASLARELQQVAKEAEQVTETLRGINLMPQRFPLETVNELCLSLVNLQDGTAEGCVEPLNFARYMLPLLRRDHFYVEGEEPEIQDEEDTFFTREHPLDHAITRLYGAVGTALDEYRAQAQDQYDDHVGAEETLEFEEDGTFAQISDASRKLSSEAEVEHQALSELAEPNSENTENLKRQIQDTANISHSIQAQIRVKPIVSRMYISAGKALRKLPDVMIKTAKLIKVGTDVGKIWVEEWSAFRKRLRNLAYNQVHGLADALQATGERLKKERRSAKAQVERQRDPEILAAERKAKQLLLAGQILPDDVAQKVETLGFRKRDGELKRPEDLLLLINIKQLHIPNLDLRKSDISALGQLTNLNSLSVHANEVSDISALGQLTNLNSLSVNASEVSDISALGQLTNLNRLTVHSSNLYDLSALEQLTKLNRLTVHASRARDVSSLRRLTNLQTLSIYTNEVSDISALGQLTNLNSLALHANRVSEFSALTSLSNLNKITIQSLNIKGLSWLNQLTNLNSLSVNTQRLDLSQIDLANLTSLTIASARDVDLEPLSKLKRLKELKLSDVSHRNSGSLHSVQITSVGGSWEVKNHPS